jgi:hypothetical protein
MPLLVYGTIKVGLWDKKTALYGTICHLCPIEAPLLVEGICCKRMKKGHLRRLVVSGLSGGGGTLAFRPLAILQFGLIDQSRNDLCRHIPQSTMLSPLLLSDPLTTIIRSIVSVLSDGEMKGVKAAINCCKFLIDWS